MRISRKRILESAAKVFEMYGASRAVLEIEYFGEVGTGLGPTLEFYTMLSHDLQRKGLAMWRGDDAAASKVATGAPKPPPVGRPLHPYPHRPIAMVLLCLGDFNECQHCTAAALGSLTLSAPNSEWFLPWCLIVSLSALEDCSCRFTQAFGALRVWSI